MPDVSSANYKHVLSPHSQSREKHASGPKQENVGQSPLSNPHGPCCAGIHRARQKEDAKHPDPHQHPSEPAEGKLLRRLGWHRAGSAHGRRDALQKATLPRRRRNGERAGSCGWAGERRSNALGGSSRRQEPPAAARSPPLPASRRGSGPSAPARDPRPSPRRGISSPGEPRCCPAGGGTGTR